MYTINNISQAHLNLVDADSYVNRALVHLKQFRNMIYLVKINEPEHMVKPPLGLLYVGDALKKSGYEVKVLHHSTEGMLECVQEVVKARPLFVGFSVFTAGGIRVTAEVCKQIKAVSDVPIVWGNAHPTLVPEQCLKESYIDIIAFYEGEETVIELANALAKRKTLATVKGIGYKEKGELKFTEPRPFIDNLDKYKLDWSLVDVNRYITPYWNLKRVISFVTSRGCPHNCSFCYNQVFNKKKWRAHSVDFVVSEVEKLKREYGIDGIRFWDDNFFVNKKRAFEIAGKINLPYFADARIGHVDEEFCHKLKETNCKEVFFGIESGSDRILNLMKKRATAAETVQAIKALTKEGVNPSASVIVGYPTETRTEYLETMKLVAQLLEINRKIVFTTGLYLPYPGTEGYRLAMEHGFTPPRRTEDWDALDRWSDKMEVTWVDHIKANEVPKIRKYVNVTATLYLLKIPILKKIAKYRLVTGNHFMDYEMRLMFWLRYYGNRNNPLIRLIRRIAIWRLKIMKD